MMTPTGPDRIPALSPSEALSSAVQQLSVARDLESVMEITLRAARLLTSCEGATFVLRDNDMSFYAAENSVGPLWKGQRLPLKVCVSGWVMKNRMPAVIEDIFQDDRVPAYTYRSTFVKSLVMVPIRTASPVGAIGCYWATPHKATLEEVQFVQALADAVAVALENIQLYAALKARVNELDQANKAKDEFLMTLSHELRSPLNSIVGWTDLLATGKLNTEETAVAIDTIKRSAKGQTQIIEDLLDTSRIITDRVDLVKVKVDLNDILQSAVQSVNSAAQAKSIEIKWDPSTTLEGILMGDNERLKQVVTNLLSNAIKFTPTGGTVHMNFHHAGPAVRIDVSDTGEGIKKDFLPHVFDRFRQADSSSTRRHGGLGLGLAIVQHLVQAHGGRVEVHSEGMGRGATFSVYLPLQTMGENIQDLSESENLMDEVPPSLLGLKVLVIDDSADVRVLVSAVLKQFGATVVTAESAKEALSKVNTFHPQVIISDLSMPEEDGFTFMRKIRRMNPDSPHLPTIALTAFADKDNRSKALEAGFDMFMSKPFQPEQLLENISSLLVR